MSGVQVRYLKIIEKSGYQALPWVRYITQNGGEDGRGTEEEGRRGEGGEGREWRREGRGRGGELSVILSPI